MWKHKLHSPLCGVLRRKLRSSWSSTSPSPSVFSLLSASESGPSTPFSSFRCSFISCVEEPESLSSPYPQTSRKFTLSVKNFCSDSTVKSDRQCWNCCLPQQTVPFLVCDSCRSVQPLDSSVDYFQIFGLREKKYDIEDKNLEGKYKEWQKKLHPDLVHSKSEREKEYAAEQSARVIDAYRTLSDPLSRAIYVLKLEGVDVDKEQTVSDPDMLVEIMEIREAVEEASDSRALNKIQTQAQEKLNQWSASFANALQSKKYEEARTSIQRMTYYKRVNEEIVKKL